MGKSIAKGLLALAFVSFEAAAQFCPGLSPWVFTDVPSSHPFCTDITWMAQRGVTLGCATLNATQRLYCPEQSVRRDQMAAFMHRLGDAILPLTCTAGQVMKWNGLAWACADDNLGGAGGGGTVTSVAASTGLVASPNPITGAGTLSVAPSYRLPQACASNQIAKWNGSAWTCAADVAGIGTLTSLSQGSGIVLTPNPIVATGTIAADTGFLQRRVTGTCAGGSSIRTINADGSVVCESDDGGPANAFVQGGNAFGTTAMLGTTDSQPLDIIVNGSRAKRYQPGVVSPSLVGGHPLNAVVAGLSGGTIGGGGGGSDPNLVHSHFSTIGGGYGNQAGDLQAGGSDYATVGGGDNNIASSFWSTVAGGYGNAASGGASNVGGGSGNVGSGGTSTVAGGFHNVASGEQSTVGGGHDNTASGNSSTVPGGAANWAGATYSVAMGFRAKVLPNAPGSFVFSDATPADFTSGTPNEFIVGATGGIGLYTAKSYATYCRINPGGGSWNCSSSREVKRDFAPVDTRDALEKVASLSLSSWRFVSEPEGVRHLGPMAEDFRVAFGLGSDERSISSVDAQGVALAAIQGLNAKVEAQSARIAELEARLAELQSTRNAPGRQEPASASASRVSR